MLWIFRSCHSRVVFDWCLPSLTSALRVAEPQPKKNLLASAGGKIGSGVELCHVAQRVVEGSDGESVYDACGQGSIFATHPTLQTYGLSETVCAYTTSD